MVCLAVFLTGWVKTGYYLLANSEDAKQVMCSGGIISNSLLFILGLFAQYSIADSTISNNNKKKPTATNVLTVHLPKNPTYLAASKHDYVSFFF